MIHSFNTDLAEQYGIEKALLLDHFCYWIAENERNEKNQIDGRTWVYNTSKALNEKFHYIPQKSIARHLKELENNGILISGNFNKVSFDRTKWYALSDEYLYLLNDYKPMGEAKHTNKKIKTENTENIDIAENEKSICQNEKSISQNEKSDFSKWEINKNIQTYTKKENSFSNENELKKNPQNENFDFRLTKKTRADKLSKIYKKELKAKIDEFRQNNPNAMSYDEFVSVLEANGYVYLNFWLAYQNWQRNEAKKNQSRQTQSIPQNQNATQRVLSQRERLLRKHGYINDNGNEIVEVEAEIIGESRQNKQIGFYENKGI